MIPVFYEVVLDVLIHHVEPVFNVVLCSSRHLLDNLRPLVTNRQPFLQNKDIFSKTERVFFNLRIKEVDPALSALLAVPGDTQASIELICDLRPLLGSVFANELDKLLVLSFDPVTFLDS